jgi:capsular polysaccharide biosynthesis protein
MNSGLTQGPGSISAFNTEDRLRGGGDVSWVGSEQIEARDVVSALAKRWVTVLIVALALGAAGLATGLLVPAQLESEAQLRVTPGGAIDLLGDNPGSYESAEEAARRLQTTAATVMSDPVVEEVASTLGLSPETVRDHVTVSPVDGANLLVVTARHENAATAAALAELTAKTYMEQARAEGTAALNAGADQLEDTVEQLLADASSPGASGPGSLADGLATRVLELRTQAALYQGDIELISAAREPAEGATARAMRTAGFGLALGCVAGVALVLLQSTAPSRLRHSARRERRNSILPGESRGPSVSNGPIQTRSETETSDRSG